MLSIPLTESYLRNRKNFSFWAWSATAMTKRQWMQRQRKKTLFFVEEMNWVYMWKPEHWCILASVLKDELSIGKEDNALCIYFRLLLVSVVWNTLEADMRFSMYWPRTWFSDFSFRFSSFTASTRADRSWKRGGTEIRSINERMNH